MLACEGQIGPSRIGTESAIGNASDAIERSNGLASGSDPNRNDGTPSDDGTGAEADGDSAGGGAPPSCDVPYAAPSSLRRLTDLQYRNSVRDMFGGAVVPTIGLPESQPNLGSTGLTAEADANIVSAVGAARIADSAEEIGVLVTAGLAAILPCFPAAQDSSCADTFIDTYGAKAFRRPLEEEERAILRSVYTIAEADFSFEERIGVVASALVQMPQFLYVVEAGEELDEPNAPEGVRRFSGYEMASRLSYLYWDSVPDSALLVAAESGELDTPDGIEVQARRLLDDDRAARPLRRFFREWLHLPEPEEKDLSVYPSYDEELAHAFDQELDSYLDVIIQDRDATPETLLTSDVGNVNSVMASFFGMDEGVSEGPSNWQRVTLPPERAGLLARPAVMAGLAYPADSAPIHRGKFVLNRLLCIELPSPPADALARQPVTPVGAGQRERSAARRQVAECAGCHDMMDPLGLGLEELDGIGQYRTQYADGSPVDTRGAIQVTTDVQGEFSGVQELTDLLSQSDDVKQCAARQWMRYALSRMDTADDGCSLTALTQAFEDADYSLHELFVAVTRTDAFRYRRLEVSQ